MQIIPFVYKFVCCCNICEEKFSYRFLPSFLTDFSLQSICIHIYFTHTHNPYTQHKRYDPYRIFVQFCTAVKDTLGHHLTSFLIGTYICSPKKKKTKQNVTQITNKLKYRKPYFYLQSKCFFFGPIISSVVALQTDLANPWPAKLCRAANSLSFIVCPAIFFFEAKTMIFFSFYSSQNIHHPHMHKSH